MNFIQRGTLRGFHKTDKRTKKNRIIKPTNKQTNKEKPINKQKTRREIETASTISIHDNTDCFTTVLLGKKKKEMDRI